MARSTRASAVAAARRIQEQAAENGSGAPPKRKREDAPDVDDADEEDDDERDDDEDDDEDDGETRAPAKKRQTRRSAASSAALATRLFSSSSGGRPPPPTCCPPARRHSVDYHRPLLLDGGAGRAARRALLAWYDGVSASRGMPWRCSRTSDGSASTSDGSASTSDGSARTSGSSASSNDRPWLDPAACLAAGAAGRAALARRAYEVWISEVMAQQTRMAVVVGYWRRWMARWPTLAALAAADADDVQRAWAGLGYYSRAARLHAAARAVAADPDLRGLLPADVGALMARVPGVGRYTAGAIAAIVFGRPAPMVDGNVVRVLSRQLGLFADAKADKARLDLLWAAAEALVQAVAGEGEGEGEAKEGAADGEADTSGSPATNTPPASDRPGRWGQALMELGSTVCVPAKPDCAACPIRSTCRAYAEGLLLHARGDDDSNNGGEDQDICDLCEPFPASANGQDVPPARGGRRKKTAGSKQASPFFDVEDAPPPDQEALAAAAAAAVGHARLFPLRVPKKRVRAVETIVCAIRKEAPRGRLFLLHKRAQRGLLAGLWQLPSRDLQGAPPLPASAAARRAAAAAWAAEWLCGHSGGPGTMLAPALVQELGSVPWLYSHLRQTMHVYVFEARPVDAADAAAAAAAAAEAAAERTMPPPAACLWASAREAEDVYSMGTGMRKCWDLVKAVA